MKMHFKWTCAALLLALSAGYIGAGDALGTTLFAGDFVGGPAQTGLADIHD